MHKFFAFSLHKAGSTLFFKLLHNTAYRSQEIDCGKKLAYVSIPDQLFNSGVPGRVMFDKNFTPSVSLDNENTIYGGFRFVPEFIGDAHLRNAGIMLLVRDPRDLLTSLYFSIVKSHVVPGGPAGERMQRIRKWASQAQIDDFVINRAKTQNWVERYRRITELRQIGKAWRYEDVVFRKAAWYNEILEYLGIDLPEEHRQDIVSREDIIPAEERRDEHIRQVKPGDYLRKLKPETIEVLNDIFREPLAAWGYSN